MNRRRTVLGLLLAAPAFVAPGQAVASAPQVTSFTATATAMPIRIDFNDPNLPVDVELDLAYTSAQAETGPTGRGRASWLWPGDAVGTGLKQIADNSGLPIPPELSKGGYPVQVNSSYPATNQTADSQADETAPGMVMRTGSGAHQVLSKAAYSPDGDVPTDEPAPAEGTGGLPGLPGLPGGPATTSTAAAEDDEPPLGQFAALVDAGAMTSVSSVSYGGRSVVAFGSSRITDLSLVGGLITADGVRVTTTTTSTLTGAKTTSKARWVGLAIAGHPFTVGKDGVQAEGQDSGPIPGLPDDAAAAMAQLGVAFELPKGTRSVSGSDAAMAIQGLHVTIDTRKLHAYLEQVPVDDVLNQFPPELQDLTKWIGAAAHLAPTIEIYLGNASTRTLALKAPTFCMTCQPAPPTPTVPGGTPVGTPGAPVSSLPGAPPLGAPPVPLAPGALTAPVDAAIQPVAAGLPPLGSVPGLLILVGLVVAGALGWGFQRIGALALGGAAACNHGLETGVPDLRKA